MDAKSCPVCKLVNPATGMECDCGYSFVTDQMTARGEERARQQEHQSWANGRLIIGVVLLVIGILVTAVTYSDASKSGGTYTIAYGAMIVGVINIVRGLRHLPR
jgi:uncharacterized membrane protein HdeD (DUF308 family)